MATNEGAIKKMLQKYKYKDLTTREVLSTIALYKDLKAVPDNYVFNDGIMKELVSLSGTIPVPYKGNVYNIPVQLWLFDTHPYNPPICFVKPTNSMMIKQSKHVDANGRIYLPYLHEWKPNTSDILGLIQVMVVVFAEEPPVFSRSANAAPNPPYGSGYTSYPAVSHPSTSYTPMPMPATPPTFPPSYPATPGGYIQYQYPGHVTPYPSQPVYNQPSPVNVVPQQDGTITEDHIRISLESAITDKLRRRFGEEMSRGQAELEALKRTEDDLCKGRQKLTNMVENLDKEIVEVDHNIELLQRKDKELTDTLKRIEEQTTNDDIDEAVVTTTPLYRQILCLYAEENATEDTIFYLGEALRRGVIDLDAFLKHVRLLSRKQFQLRALMQKARKVAGLVEQY